jgi:hypothetical protein
MEGKIYNNTRHTFQVLGTCVGNRLGQGEPIIFGHHRREHR